jgi:phosphohistidine phosphatase
MPMTKQTPNQEQSQYELYLMRHGAAAKAAESGFGNDFRRPLTVEGAEKVRRIAEGMRRLGVKPDWIVTSPLFRAVQTAEILATILCPAFPVSSSDTLRPGCSGEGLVAILAAHPDRRKVVVVGHDRDLSHLAARLIGSNEEAHLTLKKGGCCLISLTENPPTSFGQLVWWATPRILRGIS